MILINNLKFPLDTDFNNLKTVVAKLCKCRESSFKYVKLHKKSVDARRKNDVHFCCSVLAQLNTNEEKFLKLNKNAQIYIENRYKFQTADIIPEIRPIVVGFGPAGMFSALTLAKAGLKPLVIERGSCVEKRKKCVDSFFNGGPLNTECNVQFGEGGAGTFSDGKLNTGIKNPRCRTVLEIFAKMGGKDKILTDAKPHIGTDILIDVVRNIRKEIIYLGGEILFDTKLENIKICNGKINSIIANGEEITCNDLIIATGHSARDTFKMLRDNNLKMIRKPFAMGVRIEHLQSDINNALYGDFAESEYLSAADYKLACHLENGRGVYTFCMCPGGEVINASSKEGGLAINGMSESSRSGKNANSALLVGVEPEDFEGDDVLSGCELQRQIEEKAYNIALGSVPITTVGEFVFGQKAQLGKVKPTVKPKTVFADFKEIFPEFITDSLKEGIKAFDKKIKGFADKDAILTAPETRSSSPVRILRSENLESVNVKGIYPCGEGSGYAGGIVSAAVDGMIVAEKIIENYKRGKL